MLPHAAPFLFVDRALHCDEHGARCSGVFDGASPALAGHFPGDPVVPGVLLVEGMAQTLAYWALRRHPGARVLLAGIDRCRFRLPVPPDTAVEFSVTVERELMDTVHARGEASVAGKHCASARLVAHVSPPEPPVGAGS